MNNNNKPTGGASFYNTGPNYNNSSNPQASTITKFSTLSPYLAEIEKRKKAKSVLNKDRQLYRKGLNNTHKRRRNDCNKHESSSKSFRIKQKSSTSLHLHLHGRQHNTVINIIGKIESREPSIAANRGEDEYKNNIKTNNKKHNLNNIDLSKQSSYCEQGQDLQDKNHQPHITIAEKNKIAKQIQKDVRNLSKRDNKLISQPHSSHTIRLQNHHSKSKHHDINEHSNKRIVLSRNSEPNTINMNLHTMQKKQKKIYPSNVSYKNGQKGEKMGKKQKSFRKGMYENHHTFLINNNKSINQQQLLQQQKKQKERSREVYPDKNLHIEQIEDGLINNKSKNTGQKKLKIHSNTNNNDKNYELNKQSYTIDSYRHKRNNNHNNKNTLTNKQKNNSFYDKNKNRKHARCDSALVAEEREREHIATITRTTDLKETSMMEKRKNNQINVGNGKKFRKNKYEQMYSSVTSNEIEGQNGLNHDNNRVYASTNGGANRPNNISITSSRKTEPKINSHNKQPDGKYPPNSQQFDADMNKSDSRTVKAGKNAVNSDSFNNSQLIWSNNNMEMDIEAQKQINKFYRNMGSKQMKRSLQKSMQKYFSQPPAFSKNISKVNKSNRNIENNAVDNNYHNMGWIPKTNNDIQIYLSTVKAPGYISRIDNNEMKNTDKQGGQKEEKSKIREQQGDHLLFQYQFDFKQQLFLVNNSSLYQKNRKKQIKDKERGLTIDIHQQQSLTHQQNSSQSQQDSYSIDSQNQKDRVNNILDHYLENTSQKDEGDDQLQYQYQVELEEEGLFEKQRREVQRQYFHKQGPPNIEWSDQDCQIDHSQ